MKKLLPLLPRHQLVQRLILLVMILTTVTVAWAQTHHLALRTTETEIVVDGLIDAVWATADSTGEFFQMEPYYGQPPSGHTTAKVLTTTDALYCLIICRAGATPIQSVTGLLDQGSGDIVSIMLDTFDDKQSAYKFAVTAGGVRADARLLDDARNRDYSWDGVWFAESRMEPWGFVVEMKIPYKTIRFNSSLREWGLDFDRWSPASKEDLYWSVYERNEGQRISKFGRLDLGDFRPAQTGLNLELYPVGIVRARDLTGKNARVEPDAGVDVFYNPSEHLTAQLTANPDFAQIEADPFQFNISRYESYLTERRPFFTEGNEVFMASGKERNSGFYQPLELLYTRRIGKSLPDGSQVPLLVGTKAFGRAQGWEYGGFYSLTGETDYLLDGVKTTEPRASFMSARVKKTILDNSSIGVLFAGKSSPGVTEGVIDIDGAFRTSDWQLAYQIARSVRGNGGDFAGSAGFRSNSKTWLGLARVRAIGTEFDVEEVGFVPWRGYMNATAITGPVWYYDTGSLSQMTIYAGGALTYEHADLYTDAAAVLGLNMQFRNGWGGEVDISAGPSKDAGVRYTGYEIDVSTWYNISPVWDANLFGGYAKSYNFARSYLADFGWLGARLNWKAMTTLEVGTSYDMFIEERPEGGVEDITYNARPFVSLTPFNDLNMRVYVDNVFTTSSAQNQRVIVGLLFSYNFLPKSWIYFAVNELRERVERADAGGGISRPLELADRAAVLKLKYLYYL